MSSIQPYIDLMRSLRLTNSINTKMELLESAFRSDDHKLITDLLARAYDPYQPYYHSYGALVEILQDVQGRDETPLPYDFEVEYFFRLCDSLVMRRVSGNMAKSTIGHFLHRCQSDDSAQEFLRILGKDVSAGISTKTINKAAKKVFGEDIIPTYALMLAEEPKYLNTKLKYPCIVEHKYDGERVILDASQDARAGEYIAYTREGRISETNMGIWSEVVRHIALALDCDSLVLDCEVISDSFKDLAKTKSKSKAAEIGNKRLIWLDVLTGLEWSGRSSPLVQAARSSVIHDTLVIHPHPMIMAPKSRLCQDRAELEAFYDEAVEAGLEGIIAKNPNAYYAWKRSIDWIKGKPVNTADGVITALVPGKVGSKWENGIGSYVLEGETESGTKFSVNVGSGIPKKVLEDMHLNPDKYLNHHAEIKYDCVTQADGAVVFSLRFPRHKKMRPDKD